MDAQGAKVIPWNAKPGQAREEEHSGRNAVEEPRLAPIDDVLIVMEDDHIEALAAAFLMNPARKAMTFEAYLTVKGFARPVA